MSDHYLLPVHGIESRWPVGFERLRLQAVETGLARLPSIRFYE
jgi:hypothetical protein